MLLSSYTNLVDYFLPAPVSTLYTVLLAFSMCIVFDVAGIAICKQKHIWARALYFFNGLLVTSWLIWLLALFHYSNREVFTVMAAVFVLSAGVCITINWSTYLQSLRDVFQVLRERISQDRIPAVICILVLVVFFLTAIAPPTDADSLDYHLGAPLDILNTGNLWISKDNLHFRLTGFGEMINLLGIANGCISLGSVLQFVALLWFMTVLLKAFPASAIKTGMLILGMPVLLFFISGQKSQLLGIFATSLCSYILFYKKDILNRNVVLLLLNTLLFAIGLKHSFIISVCVLVFYLIWDGRGRYLLPFILMSIVVLGPVFFYRYTAFADPLSPLAEHFKSNPDDRVVGLHKFLKSFSDSSFPFPLNLFIPSSIGNISTLLGVHALILLFCFTAFNRYTKELCTVALFILLMTLFGQKTSRFFIEPYLWLLPVFIASINNSRSAKYIAKAAQLQFYVMLPVILFSAYSLAPALVSDALREKVLMKYSFGYAESKWLDEVLPADAHIASRLRSRAYLPRPYFPREYFNVGIDTQHFAVMNAMLHQYKVNYIVLKDPAPALVSRLKATCVAGPQIFFSATRNPFNSRPYTLTVYKTGYY